MAEFYVDTAAELELYGSNFPIIISVHSGNGQGGGYVIKNGSQRIATNTDATVLTLAEFKKLLITAVIKDKLEETNWTSVTVRIQLANSHVPVVFGPYEYEVPQHSDTVFYTILLKLKKP